jgi:hypothetical protein
MNSKTILETSATHDEGMVYRIPCPIKDCDYVFNVCLASKVPAATRHQRAAFKQQDLRIEHPNHGEEL